MEDELINDDASRQLWSNKQTELLSTYCFEIEHLISQTTTMNEAEHIAEKYCREFELKCTSGMIQRALRKYVHDIINRKWNVR